MNQKNTNITMGPGAASLTLIFVMVSISVLAMLSLMSSRSDARLSERSVEVAQEVYAMNEEYDHIRSLIERDPEMWQKMKGTYWRKRYHNYRGTLRRIDPAGSE